MSLSEAAVFTLNFYRPLRFVPFAFPLVEAAFVLRVFALRLAELLFELLLLVFALPPRVCASSFDLPAPVSKFTGAG